jgi:hypothetical protein
LCLAVSLPCTLSKIIKGGIFRVHLHNGEHQRVVVGGSAGTKRRAAAILSDFGFKVKPGAPSPSGRSSSACSHPSWGVVERKAKRGRTPGRLVPQEEMVLDTVVSGSAGKRRRNGDNRNDRNSKRSAVMRVCTTGGKEMGVTWELVGLALRQVAVKWSTTGE